MELTLGELVARLGGELAGDAGVRVRQVASLESAGDGDLAFLSNPRLSAALAGSQASAFILAPKAAGLTERPRVITPDPYLYFARAAQLFNPPKAAAPGIHATAVVASSLPASVSVGPQAVIGEDCRIGENCVIGPGCVIGDKVVLGAGSLLHGGVRIYDHCVIGARAIMHAGVVIGADGLGFARDADKHWVKIPQIGRVIIGDDVEIGANTAIDRGALDDTVIGNGVKLDNLIHVAHNCQIGDDTILAAMVGMAGSTRLGKRVMAGGKAGFSGHLEVADDVVVSADTNVTKTIDKAGVYTSLLPIQPHADWVRNFAHLRRLDAMAERLRELEKKLAQMEKES
ncbi:UDP-3-O-(3-hydroxymyristoyl)glucosamine N-acyltransferase [Zoogloea sp.]|uniref:UDP-3-O-(3-hydroxymyristoyl)glucosamine N-acyltransferase n=1 Tax=Zoogloea sp. TaxID=49181 RepID=UPI00261E9D7E|nr:UDP-3-O-(3-hydroxymyristoyl)glucosamine N-acyltransferase [Zoogloea sp.]MDD3354391.1 UDP-3-O-(3-hydroxymyristoyl)glucosamine N-acyltransferase [Zoogloea sp.]